jgi:hypothetical protein
MASVALWDIYVSILIVDNYSSFVSPDARQNIVWKLGYNHMSLNRSLNHSSLSLITAAASVSVVYHAFFVG